MITSVNKNNNIDYILLYRKVEEFLKTHNTEGVEVVKSNDVVYDVDFDNPETYNPGGAYDSEDYFPEALRDNPPAMPWNTFITSLEELFSWMQVLRQHNPILTRFPLDEPYFEIKANERTIVVPPEFSKSSAFVQGDEIAESIYFKVDRFYDHVDLATQSIYIQYVNANKEQYVSIPPVVDIDSEPGYIIIEWPISSKVTAKAGAVQFSVRFFTYDETETDESGHGKIVYSLSTLPQSISIKASQDFDLVSINETEIEMQEDNKRLMENRLVNSPIYNSSNVSVASKPVFWSDYIFGEGIQNVYSYELEDGSKVNAIDLEMDENGFTVKPVKFNAQAHAEDGGQLTYYWVKNIDDQIEYSIKMVETEDSAPVASKVYYVGLKGDNEEITGYKLVGAVESFEANEVYFERVSEGIFDSIGSYYVTAKNRVRNAVSESDTKVCYVPSAKEPGVGLLASSAILTFNSEDNSYDYELELKNIPVVDHGKMTYVWSYAKSKEGPWTELTDELNTSKVLAIKNASVEEEIPEDATKIDAIIFNDGNKVVSEEEDKIFAPSIEDSKEGYYKVKIINNLNGTSKEKENETICRVTFKAIKPKVDVVKNAGDVFASIENEDNVVARFLQVPENNAKNANKGLKVVVDESSLEGKREADADFISYRWFRYQPSSNTQLIEDVASAAKGLYAVSKDILVPDNATDTLVLTDSMPNAYYYCEVTNHYNGTTSSRCSQFFNVVSTIGDAE